MGKKKYEAIQDFSIKVIDNTVEQLNKKLDSNTGVYENIANQIIKRSAISERHVLTHELGRAMEELYINIANVYAIRHLNKSYTFNIHTMVIDTDLAYNVKLLKTNLKNILTEFYANNLVNSVSSIQERVREVKENKLLYKFIKTLSSNLVNNLDLKEVTRLANIIYRRRVRSIIMDKIKTSSINLEKVQHEEPNEAQYFPVADMRRCSEEVGFGYELMSYDFTIFSNSRVSLLKKPTVEEFLTTKMTTHQFVINFFYVIKEDDELLSKLNMTDICELTSIMNEMSQFISFIYTQLVIVFNIGIDSNKTKNIKKSLRDRIIKFFISIENK